MSGGGDTKAEALLELRQHFDSFKTEKTLPRPGTGLPIEFASQESIARNAELAEDFVQRICEVDWAWLSDESSLWDFHGNEDNEAMFAKIRDVYGVDVSDIDSAKIGLILDRIAKSRLI